MYTKQFEREFERADLEKQHIFQGKGKRITRLIRVSERWHEYAQAQSRELGRPMSQIVDLAFKYYSGERKREKAESEARFRAIFPK